MNLVRIVKHVFHLCNVESAICENCETCVTWVQSVHLGNLTWLQSACVQSDLCTWVQSACVQFALGQKKDACVHLDKWFSKKGDDEWFSKNRKDGKVIFLSLCNLHIRA